MASNLASLTRCEICFKPMRIEDCKVDDRGLPVHEDCLVERMRFRGKDIQESPRPCHGRMNGGA